MPTLRPEKSSGTTLIELIVAMAMLSLLTALLFGAFEMGTRVFRDTTVRQTSENQLRSIKLLLERDANHTNFWYCNKNALPRSVGGKNRDALAMSTLDDWESPANFDSLTLRPVWNRYIVWYADQSSPTGTLYRQLVEPPLPSPPDPPGFITPYGALGANINEEPALNEDVIYTRSMSEDVIDFTVNLRFENGTIETILQLRAEGIQRPGTQDRTEENLQVRFTFQPKNTWPRI